MLQSAAIVVAISLLPSVSARNTIGVGPPYNPQCSFTPGDANLWNDCITMFQFAQSFPVIDKAAWAEIITNCDNSSSGYCIPKPVIASGVVTVTAVSATTILATTTVVADATEATANDADVDEDEDDDVKHIIPFSGEPFIRLPNKSVGKMGHLPTDSLISLDSPDRRKLFGFLDYRRELILNYGTCNAFIRRSGLPVNFTMIEEAAAQIWKRCALTELDPSFVFRPVTFQIGRLGAKVDLQPQSGGTRLCVGDMDRC